MILAAGGSTRFGSPKQLALLDGRPLLEYAVRAMNAVPSLRRVVVVLGANAPEIRQAVDFGRAETIVCEEWAEGQAASLRAGARALAGTGAVVVALGDQPYITPEIIARMVEAGPGTRAAYHGEPGHPVVLRASELRAVERLTGDVGARSLIANYATIDCTDLGSAKDVDTPADL